MAISDLCCCLLVKLGFRDRIMKAEIKCLFFKNIWKNVKNWRGFCWSVLVDKTSSSFQLVDMSHMSTSVLNPQIAVFIN